MATATIRATKVSRNTSGRFGAYGGRYVPETLMSALEELEREYEKAKRDRKFRRRRDKLLRTAAGGGSAPRGLWLANLERRDQRSYARLGDERSHYALLVGQRAGSASVPDHGARLSQSNWPRNPSSNSSG